MSAPLKKIIKQHLLVAAVRASLKSAPFVYLRGFYILRGRSVICFRYNTHFPVIAFNYRARMRIVTHSFRWRNVDHDHRRRGCGQNRHHAEKVAEQNHGG
jgi:hypothetical protein